MSNARHVAAATTPAALADAAERLPERNFLIGEDGLLTYAQTAALCADIAAELTLWGLRPGERIGVLLPNGVRWCAAYLAAHAAGLCVVPLNTWYRAEELLSVVRRAGLRAVITDAEVFGFRAADAVSDVSTSDYLGALRWPAHSPRPVGLPDATRTPDPIAALRSSRIDGASDALVLFTSGSSAEPKAVRLTHQGILRNARAVGERQGVRAGDRFWIGSPLFFVFGCGNALPNALVHGATLCLQERFEPESALKFIERHRCTVYYGVAPVTRALASSSALGRHDISSLRTGTANATPDDLRIAIEVLGVEEVCNAYGMTEAYGHTAMTTHTDPAEVRIESQGTVLPTQQLRIVAGGVADVVGTPGDIQIRGNITPGYLDGAEAADSPLDENGWFATGDIGLVDEHGRLHYLGRKDEMLKIKGVNISPLEIERLLVRHEMVDEAFVFGVRAPDGELSVGCALVSPAPADRRQQLARDVQAWVRERAAAYKAPRTVRILLASELPLTTTGKVSRRLLAEQMQDALGRNAAKGDGGSTERR